MPPPDLPLDPWTADLFDRVTQLPDVSGPLEAQADVIVVGSGAGGAVVAAELAVEGRSVILLEEGSLFTTADLALRPRTRHATRSIQRYYRDAGASLIAGSPPIRFAEGRCVGGSTLINGGMTWRTPPRILEGWHREEGLIGLAPKDLEPIFGRVERRISARVQDPESIGRDTTLLRAGADRLGYRTIDNIRNQRHCAGSNNCAFGCPTGAKQSTAVTYVPDALRAGARLFTNCRVRRVLFKRGRTAGVKADIVDHVGRRRFPARFFAPIVVLACGAAQTPALLHRSGIRHRLLGKNLKVHPNAKLVALFDEPVRGWEGVHQGAQVREFQDEGLLLALANIPPGLLAMSMPSYGRRLATFMERYAYMHVAGVLAEDTGSGFVRCLPGGRPLMRYQLTELDMHRLLRGLGLLAEILFAAGAREIHAPFAELPPLRDPGDIHRLFDPRLRIDRMEVVTVHIMGTARMGRDPSRGVTDPWGHVWGPAGLLVADASLFPGPIGVNPMETIMALATRTAWSVLDRWVDLVRG